MRANRPTTTVRPKPPRRAAVIVVALLLAVIAAACSSDSGDDSARDSADSAPAPTALSDGESALGFGGEEEAAVEEADAAAEAAADDGGAAPGSAPVSPTAVTGERIIKEGTVTIEVEPGEFDAAFSQLISRVQGLGGHVAGSSSATNDEGLVSGQITIRVPVRSFEDLLTVVGEAGAVVDRSVSSQDVTAEFTDLESRLRNLRAQETFYLGLLEEAETINDAIAIQQQLQAVTEQIEQITGRLNLLEDRSSFSTLTVRLREIGAEPLDPVADEGFAQYVETARQTLVGTIGGLLIALTFALPFAILALLGYGIYLLVRRGRSAHADAAPAVSPGTPSSATPEPEPATTGPSAPQEDLER